MQQQAVGDSPRYSRVCVSSSSQQQTPQLPPSPPPRSPLRPRPSSIVATPLDDNKAAREEEIAMAYASLTGMAAAVVVDREKPLPEVEDEDEVKTTTTTTSLTKRQHALHELLSSERAYASDLALVREVHIPLALGQQIPHSLPVSPPNSSGSSSRTHSTASDASSSSAAAAAATTAELGPPMSPDDVKIIFSNITEIAVFSDLFCQALEEALGDLLEGGKGDDHVGALFLSIIPELERPYKQYITRHPTALNHLQQLPQTPAVQNYLSYTQTIASSLSHAWDLSSLLIKPVQRLLKYPLLLAAIIDETPDFHPDKDNLVKARKQMEEVARNVNEGRRRAEVIRDVLTSKKKPGVAGGHGVTVAASVNLTKVKSLRVNPGLRNGAGGGSKDEKTPEEAILVEKLEEELKQIEFFAQQFAKHIVEWARSTSTVVLSLRTWSLSFAKVIGLTPEQGSEAFDAFLVVVEKQLMPLCVDLEAVINEKVLKELAHLLMTMNLPLKLLASMNEQEPYHYHLMNMNVSQKNRPPPSLLAASTNYLALRGQLAAELPMYIALLHKGLRIFVYRLTAIQTEFWSKVRDQWLGLWEMLRLEEELNVGHEETISVWNARWVDIAEVLASMSIVQDPQVVYQQLKEKVRSGRAGAGGGVDKRESRERERELRERERERERERIERDRDIGEEHDAEYYVQHHLQAFAHRQSNMPETHTRNPNYVGPPHRNSTATSTGGGGGGSHQQRTPPQGYYTPSIPPSSPPSTAQSTMFSDGPPNSPNSFTTSVTSSISGGGDRRDSRDQQGYSQSHHHPHHPRTHSRDPREHRERDRHEREKKKSSAQAANAISLLGALEPSSPSAISPKSPKSPKKGGGHSPVNVSGRGRGNSDVSSFVSGASGSGSGSGGSTAGGGGLGSWMGSVGMGGTFGASGGIVTGISSTTSGSGSGGGGGKKGVQKKASNDSFVSKGTTATIRSPAPQHSLSSPPSSSRPHQSSPRQPTPHPGSHSHPPHQNRRRTPGGGVEPAPEDLREYEVMMMREKGEHGSRPGTAGTTTSNNARSPNPNLNVNEYHHNHHPGLPRTKSMPLPYHPQHPQQRPPSQRHSSSNNTTAGHQHHHHQGDLYSQQQQQMKRSAGDWSTSAECADDQEDIELFYHSQSQISYHDVAGHDVGREYERERDRDQEYEMRNTARPRERPRDTTTGMSGHRNRSERERSAKGHSHSRQRSVGKDSDERKSYSEHSTYSNKSRDGKGDKDREKDRDKDKDKDKPSSSSRKRSGSIKSITSFFTSTNRNSNSHDRQNIGDISSTSLTQVPSTTTTTLTDHTPSPRDSWALKPAKYTCIVIHPCKPPTTGPNSTPLSYFSFPFFTLEKGELYDVLQEAGHPSLHPNLPLIVDEGEDCLLLCRSRWEVDRVGWALASFLEPCSTSEE